MMVRDKLGWGNAVLRQTRHPAFAATTATIVVRNRKTKQNQCKAAC